MSVIFGTASATATSRTVIRSSGRQMPAMKSARPSSTHKGTFRRISDRGMMSNSKMCVISWVISRYSWSGGSSIGSTSRSREGSAKAATPSGMSPWMMFCCWNSDCVLNSTIGTLCARSCFRSELICWYALSA